MRGSLPPGTRRSSQFEEGNDRNQGAQRHEVLLQPPPQHPRATDLTSSPGRLASTLVGGLKGNQETTPALTDLTVLNEVETIVVGIMSSFMILSGVTYELLVQKRSALEDVTHLSVPPSRLTIIPNTEIGWGKYGEVVQAILDGSSQTPIHVAVKELRNVGTRDGRGRIALTNILINGSLHAVLGDFGLASLMQDSDTSSGLTTSRTAKGSLRYMSPELHLEDDAKPTLASDVWAWGCTAFEVNLLVFQIFRPIYLVDHQVVTGRLPYQEANKDAKVLLAIAQEHQPPGSIKSLISQLMESNTVDALPVL
ncbi:hypothetical protein FRC01_005717, partial [Tulasnella sp. 417]